MTGGLAYELTRLLGGDWHGSYGTVPAPGHSKRDRSLSIKSNPHNPNDVILHSFAGEQWKTIKDELRRRGSCWPWVGGIDPLLFVQTSRRRKPSSTTQKLLSEEALVKKPSGFGVKVFPRVARSLNTIFEGEKLRSIPCRTYSGICRRSRHGTLTQQWSRPSACPSSASPDA